MYKMMTISLCVFLPVACEEAVDDLVCEEALDGLASKL